MLKYDKIEKIQKWKEVNLKNKIKNGIYFLSIITILIIIIFILIVVINSRKMNNEISLGDWSFFIVLSGSMEKEINIGDIVLVKKIEPRNLKEGDIISFEQKGETITHRIVEIQDKEIYTKGDNNNSLDIEPVNFNSVKGKVEYKIPKLGIFILKINKSIFK